MAQAGRSAEIVAGIQRSLQAAATEKTRQFWDRYIPGQVWRGVAMAGVRGAAAGVCGRYAPEDLKEAAYALFDEEAQEDRLAGILLLEWLTGTGGGATSAAMWTELPRIAAVFAAGRLDNWSLCDWMSLKFLARLVPDPEARAILASWRGAASLWQRRAACVAFIPAAKEQVEQRTEILALVLENCAALAQDPARFAQTGVGWTLREWARADRAAVLAFAARHAARLSAEAVRTITEHMPEERAGLMALRKGGAARVK